METSYKLPNACFIVSYLSNKIFSVLLFKIEKNLKELNELVHVLEVVLWGSEEGGKDARYMSLCQIYCKYWNGL